MQRLITLVLAAKDEAQARLIAGAVPGFIVGKEPAEKLDGHWGLRGIMTQPISEQHPVVKVRHLGG